MCGSFLPFLHTWTDSNALKVMCSPPCVLQPLQHQHFRCLFSNGCHSFPKAYVTLGMRKTIMPRSILQVRNQGQGQEQAGWGPKGRMSLHFSLFLSHHIQIVTEWNQFYLSSLHSGKEPKPHDDQTVFNFHVATTWFPSPTMESCLQHR